jgi:hypothetical protein
MRLGTPVDYFYSHERHASRRLFVRPGRPHSVPNSWRLQAFFTILFGLSTFFFPLVNIDPPVAGIAHWSSFNIVQQAYRGNLPKPICERCGEPTVRALLGLPASVSAIYLLMVGALFPLTAPYTSDLVATIGGFGVLAALYLNKYRNPFRETFYGAWSRPGQANDTWLQLTLIAVMALLFVISAIGD